MVSSTANFICTPEQRQNDTLPGISTEHSSTTKANSNRDPEQAQVDGSGGGSGGGGGGSGKQALPSRWTAPETRRTGLYASMARDFSPIWFTWCMNSGIIGILLHQLPYQFSGLHIIATVFYVFDLITFIFFSMLFISRFALFGAKAYRDLASKPLELGLLACWPIGWMTLAGLTALIVSRADWNGTGHAFTVVAYVMWWFGAAFMLTVLLYVVLTIVRRHELEYTSLPPSVLLPCVGVATVATMGGLIASFGWNISARLAVPTIIVAFMLVGVGLMLAIFLYTIMLQQLLHTGWPSAEIIPNLWMFVGPMGQSAAALQLLGSAANKYGRFAGYGKGTFLTGISAEALDAACVLLALLLAGMGIVWTFVAAYAMIETAWNRKLSWTPAWNSLIFPLGTLAVAFLQFSIEMDSPAFRVVTTGMVIWMVFLFLLNLGFTVLSIAKGDLLIATAEDET